LSRAEAIEADQERILLEIEQIRSSIEELKTKNSRDKDQSPEEMAKFDAKLVQQLQLKAGQSGAACDDERSIHSVENNILDSLRFSAMSDRQKAIDEVNEKTRDLVE
jgi:hypothetical protein